MHHLLLNKFPLRSASNSVSTNSNYCGETIYTLLPDHPTPPPPPPPPPLPDLSPWIHYNERIPSRLISLIDKCEFKQAYNHVQKNPDEIMRWYKNKEGRRMLPMHLLCERVGIPDTDAKSADYDKRRSFSFKCVMGVFFGHIRHTCEWERQRDSFSLGGTTTTTGRDYSFDLFGFLYWRYPDAVKIQDDMGQLPIHIACRSRAPLKYVQVLIEIYRDGTTRLDNEGCSPLALSVQFAAPPEIVSCVLKAFPEALYINDIYDFNPLKMAIINNNSAVVKILGEARKLPSPSAPPAPQDTSSRQADYQRKMSDDRIVPKPMPRDEKPNYKLL